MVSTLDSESSHPSSNLGGTYIIFFTTFYCVKLLSIFEMKPSNSFPAWKELYVHIIPCNFSSCREMLSGMVSFLFRGGRTQQKYNAHALSPIFLNTLNTDARPQNCTTTNYTLHFNMLQDGCTSTPKSPW